MKIDDYHDRDFFDTRHGGAFDRGAADNHYGRQIEPHYFVDGTNSSEKVTKLTPFELRSYMAGYAWNELFGDKKSWD